MKILYVSHLFLPRFSGGTEVLTFQVAREMRRRGHQVAVLACEDWQSGRKQITGFDQPYEGIPVHRLRLDAALTPDPVRAQYYSPAIEQYLLPRLRRERPDIVHVHHFGHVTTAVATAAYETGIPVLFTATDFWLVCPTSQLLRYDRSLCNGPTNMAKCAKCLAATYRRARPYRRMLHAVPEPMFNWAARNAAGPLRNVSRLARGVTSLADRAEWNRKVAAKLSRLLVASRFMRERLAENQVPTNPMELVGFGIDTSWTAQLSERRFTLPVRIGFIGAFSPHKGVHVLIDAFRQLQPADRAELHLYGRFDYDPVYGQQVQAQAMGVKGIQFCGTFPHQQMGKVLSNLDVLVIPSLWYENAPLVLHSALAARLPVIVSDMGGLQEIVREEQGGLVVPAGDPEALAAALERCLKERGLLPRLSSRTPPVKDITEYARELIERYEAVLAHI